MKRLIEGKIQKGLQQHAEQRVKGRWAYWQRQTGCTAVSSQAINTEYKQLCERKQAGAKCILVLYLTYTSTASDILIFTYDRDISPGSANQCILGDVFLRSNLSRKL